MYLRRVSVLAVAVVAAALLAPGTGVAGAATTGCSTASHERALAKGETKAIAAELVDVPGYCYLDVPAREVKLGLSRLAQIERQVGDVFSAMSLHSVVSDNKADNTARGSTGPEVGFLQLYAFTEPPPAGIEQALAQASVGIVTDPETLTISGQTVYLFEDPSSPDTRYTYTWLRHGVQGGLDGADRAPLEAWLTKYLASPDVSPTETDALSQWLVPVPGYLLADFESPKLEKLMVTKPLGKVPYAVHRVTDATGEVGTLVLSQPKGELTAAQYADALGFGTVGATTETVGTTPVLHYTVSGGDAYIWVQDGIAGAFLTTDPGAGAGFVNGLLTAPR